METSPPIPKTAAPNAWRIEGQSPSLPEVHDSVAVPKHFGFWRKMLAFSGPGYLVAVGYMDPGNWATGFRSATRRARWF